MTYELDLNLVTEKLNELGYPFELVDTGGNCIYPHLFFDELHYLVISDDAGDLSLHLYVSEDDFEDLEDGISTFDDLVELVAYHAHRVSVQLRMPSPTAE